MATFQEGDRHSVKSAVDLSEKPFRIVKRDTKGDVVLATAGTDVLLGTVANMPKKGATADVVLLNGTGSFKAVASAAIARDALITATTDGKAVTAVAGDRAIGRALYAAVAGEVFEYLKLNEKA